VSCSTIEIQNSTSKIEVIKHKPTIREVLLALCWPITLIKHTIYLNLWVFCRVFFLEDTKFYIWLNERV